MARICCHFRLAIMVAVITCFLPSFFHPLFISFFLSLSPRKKNSIRWSIRNETSNTGMGGCVSLKTFHADKLAQDAIPLEDMNHWICNELETIRLLVFYMSNCCCAGWFSSRPFSSVCQIMQAVADSRFC